MVRTITSSLGIAALLVVALTGCPGGMVAGSNATCTKYEATLAEYYERCEIRSALGPNNIKRAEEACAKELAAPGVTDLAARLDRCANEVAGAACGDEVACLSEIIAGSLEEGAACASGAQCRSGLCDRDSHATCGACASPAERMPVGLPCGARRSVCVDGARCVMANDIGKCLALATGKVGESCGPDAETVVICAKGLRCFVAGDEPRRGTCRSPAGVGGDCHTKSDCTDDLSCIKGKCMTRLSEGAPCDASEFLPCAKGLACDGACKPIIFVKAGEVCDEGLRRCERGDCVAANDVEAKCVERVPEGMACSDQTQRCDAPAGCIAGTCTVRDPSQCR